MQKVQPKTRLLVVRHGETEWNRQQRFQGHGDSPLTEQGRSDVTALGKRLNYTEGKMGTTGMHFDNLISSDLGRAIETATLIADHTGHDIITDSRLRERNYGVMEGLTIEEIKTLHADSFERLVAGDPDEQIPGGESHRQLYDRNIHFIEQLLENHSGSTALLVVHGGVLDSFLRMVTHLPLDHPRCFTAVNASLNIFTHGPFFRDTRWVIETWGDVAHLSC